MPYTYKYYPASFGTINKNPKDEYIDLFERNLYEEFYNASDVFTVSEETSLGSGTYQNVDVRINKVIDVSTGERVGDDFKKLLFRDLGHPTGLGWMYNFDSNYWVAVNIDKIKSLTTSVTIRRCNNVLKWFDDSGGYHEVPCALGYLIKENRDYSTSGSNLVAPSGMIECYVQMNADTNLIRPNQRFLFGNTSNWIAYRVEGGGINNFLFRETTSSSSVGIVTLSLSVDYVNEDNDDLTNGIANKKNNLYTLELNQTAITGSIGQTRTLQAVVRLSNQIVDRTVIWQSSNTAKATVNSSGIVTFVANGTATISCYLDGNTSIIDTCGVTVSATPTDTYQIVYSPEKNFVLDGASVTWTFQLYKNGAVQADAFTFSLNPNTVPASKYLFMQIDGNNFVIQNNEMYLDDNLTVTATSGANSLDLDVYLRGSW